jgi:hypothetical protein
MGSTSSRSNSSQFFLDHFGQDQSFIYVTETDEKILFSYNEKDIRSNYFKINAEHLIQPWNSSVVTIRDNKNCKCKSDLAKYEPTMTFYIFFDEEGFYNKKYVSKDSRFKSLINDLENNLRR